MIPARSLLFNRSPQAAVGGWIHIVPKGELANAAANLVQVIDDPALDSILRNLDREKTTLGNRWPGLYAGREHFIYDEDQDSAALAWFKQFEKRPDGIWANADGLTPPGRQAIANGDYKFTSFVADRKDTEKLAGNRVRILKVETIGFTNQANGKELLTPITNRSAGTLQGVETLSAPHAGERFSAIVNRTKTANGWTFEQAWNHCRIEEKDLFNRMAAPAPAASTKPTAPSVDRAQVAGQALRKLAEDFRRLNGVNFDDAWRLITNRRHDLYRLANRELPPEAWAVLETQAFGKFTDALNLGPDGKLSHAENPEAVVECFQKSYAAMCRREPNLDPRALWEKIKTEWPAVYWPFVAVTAQ